MPGLEAGELPFVGPATADQINAILSTGTCAALECFRRDLEVTDSRGVRRRGTDGAATRAKFASLPGVAARTASRWWYAGLRSFEDVEHAAQPGGLLSPDGAFPLSVEQAFSLRHRKDLLEPVPPQDIDEVMETVLQTLGQVSFPGWSVSLAGGGRRGTAAHDVDLLATHPSECIEVLPESGESIVSLLVARLVADGKMVDAHTAMCRVQQGLMGSHIEHIKQEHAKEESDAPGRQTLDRFDHIYGVFCTSRGKYRRFDVIFIPQEEYGFGELGWIGSRTFLRFQRQHAKELGMYLNSHGLFVKQAHGSRLVPQEGPPKRKDGSESWPPGWSEDRRVRSEKDVFDLLEMPYRPPEDREAL
jgi:DNA polymerase/3'-5' exonuclease PolX